MNKNDALRLALEALDSMRIVDFSVENLIGWNKAIAAIEQAIAAQPALPDAITDNSESPEFRAGWNECREVMAGMMK